MARAGGKAAFAELFARHRKTLFGVVQRITRNIEDTEDVIQDCSIKALVNLEAFEGDAAFSTWLVRIGINTALMMLRKRRRVIDVSIDDPLNIDFYGSWQIAEPSKNPEMQLLDRELHSRVYDSLSRLPTALRTIMEAVILEDMTLKELANMAGISVAATKSRLYRARIALRRTMPRTRKQFLEAPPIRNRHSILKSPVPPES